MKFTSVLSTAILAGSAIAADVDCLVNGVAVATVDKDTGVCPFTIPAAYPPVFDFVSWDEYDCTAFYSLFEGIKYWTDIRHAGNVVSIPAHLLYGLPPIDFYRCHADKTPPANSTAAIRRRLLKQVEVAKRDDVDDFVAYIETLDGTVLPGGSTFAVVDAAAVSSPAASPTGTQTVIEESTTVITITSCSNNACSGMTVPATPSEVVTTVNEEVTTYTTYCPLETTITITSCKNDACHETVVPAVPSLTTGTIEGEVTSYYTYCPLTAEETLETTVITITSCSAGVCTEVPSTVAPATTKSTVAAESTGAATTGASTVAPISTYEAGAAKFGSSVFALVLAPLALLI